MIEFFKTIIYIPLYNLLVLFLNIDWIDAGVAAVVLTVLVKMVLYPLTKKSIVTQVRMKEKEKELADIKKKYKDRQEQAVKVMEFYKENNINPFSGILGILLQIPIIYSLFYIFSRSGLPTIDLNILYPFIKVPASVSMNFLGLVDISQKSLILAVFAALSTFWQMRLAAPAAADPNASMGRINAEDFSKMMAKQMKYTMPIIVFLVSWQTSGALALYWFVSNLVGLGQELYIKKRVIPRS